MENATVMKSRGPWYWAFVIAAAIGCLAGFYLWGGIYSYRYSAIIYIFNISLAYGAFCLLFELATLISAKRAGIPDETDTCKKVSYWMTFILTVTFPAIVVLRLFVNNLNLSGVVLGLLLSYGLFSAIWFFLLIAYGYSSNSNIILNGISGGSRGSIRSASFESKKAFRAKYGQDNLCDLKSETESDLATEKRNAQNKLTITDNDWYKSSDKNMK